MVAVAAAVEAVVMDAREPGGRGAVLEQETEFDASEAVVVFAIVAIYVEGKGTEETEDEQREGPREGMVVSRFGRIEAGAMATLSVAYRASLEPENLNVANASRLEAALAATGRVCRCM